MVPIPLAMTDHFGPLRRQRRANQSGYLDRLLVEMARADAIDQGRHDDVSLYAHFQAGLDYREVRLSLSIWLFLIAHLLVGVDVFFVREDVLLDVFAGDWLIAQVGCA